MEAQLGCRILNTMTRLGMPDSYRLERPLCPRSRGTLTSNPSHAPTPVIPHSPEGTGAARGPDNTLRVFLSHTSDFGARSAKENSHKDAHSSRIPANSNLNGCLGMTRSESAQAHGPQSARRSRGTRVERRRPGHLIGSTCRLSGNTSCRVGQDRPTQPDPDNSNDDQTFPNDQVRNVEKRPMVDADIE